MTYDPRYFTTYYAIDAINFKPADLSSALDTIEGPYLPLIVQEAAGLPLESLVRRAKKERLERCKGLFYACAGGAGEAAFNQLLIERRPDRRRTAMKETARLTQNAQRGAKAAMPGLHAWAMGTRLSPTVRA